MRRVLAVALILGAAMVVAGCAVRSQPTADSITSSGGIGSSHGESRPASKVAPGSQTVRRNQATTMNPNAAACSRNVSHDGSMTVCPGTGPVGTSVTVSGSGCKYIAALVFLGPGAYIGSQGGGDEITIKPTQQGDFNVKYTIPPTYASGGGIHPTSGVVPGTYHFGSYPADICSVPFQVIPNRG